jgi:hypothetical protein
MRDLDMLEQTIESTNKSVAVAAPWAKLNTLDNKVAEYQVNF